MSENAAGCRIHTEQWQDIPTGGSEYKPYDGHRKNTFQTVSKKGKNTSLSSESAQSIGRSGIPAAMFADIRVIHASDKIGCLK